MTDIIEAMLKTIDAIKVYFRNEYKRLSLTDEERLKMKETFFNTYGESIESESPPPADECPAHPK